MGSCVCGYMRQLAVAAVLLYQVGGSTVLHPQIHHLLRLLNSLSFTRPQQDIKHVTS